MSREMRRKERQMNEEQVRSLIAKGNTGILSLNGENGYPYSVPVNYVYFNDAIYIHGSVEGRKVDLIKADERACFCSIVNSEILVDKLTAAYESFIAVGTAEMVEDCTEKEEVLKYIVDSLSVPEFQEKGYGMVAKMLDRTGIIKFSIEEVSGKANGNSRWE